MKKNFIKSLFTLLLLLVMLGVTAGSAFAQDDPLPEAGAAMGAGESSGNVKYAKESTYDFEADDVEGAIVRPEEANISGERHGKMGSLIEIRTDFAAELLISIDGI